MVVAKLYSLPPSPPEKDSAQDAVLPTLEGNIMVVMRLRFSFAEDHSGGELHNSIAASKDCNGKVQGIIRRKA
jgi:hypothetical protein